MKNPTAAFIDSPEAYVAYNAAVHMRDKRANELKTAMMKDARVTGLIAELGKWPGPSIASHKSAQQFFHKLAFLADIGVTADDKGVSAIIKKIVKDRDANGIPTLPVKIPEAYGGSGRQEQAWALCDAPTVLYALIVMGFSDRKIDTAVDYLAGNVAPNGWGCIVSEKLGSWRGPGKKSDPCPYATLIMTKMLLQYDLKKYKKEIGIGAETLLGLWTNSRKEHPYIFYMGTDFRKLKLPFIWYDILHVTDVLSRIPGISKDKRFMEMLAIIEKKEKNGCFVPESVYQPWSDWDFGQKKAASDRLTFSVRRIQQRVGV
ncbi:MAG: hypothetical protein HZC28_08335 [Spirochaetes bacterium]|nr:hypothetical protein [Spirochaetota bacterium]